MGIFEWLSRVANNVIEKAKEMVSPSPADKKFNEIFNEIFNNGHNLAVGAKYFSIYKDNGQAWVIEAYIVNGKKTLKITWWNWNNNAIKDMPGSSYILTREWWKYSLKSGRDSDFSKGSEMWPNNLKNLTEKELLNNVLPKFEKRLNEAKNRQRQERQKSINNAGKYAYEKDQNDTDKLLEWLENPDNSNLA